MLGMFKIGYVVPELRSSKQRGSIVGKGPGRRLILTIVALVKAVDDDVSTDDSTEDDSRENDSIDLNVDVDVKVKVEETAEVEVEEKEDDALAEDRSVDDEGSFSRCMSMDYSNDVVL